MIEEHPTRVKLLETVTAIIKSHHIKSHQITSNHCIVLHLLYTYSISSVMNNSKQQLLEERKKKFYDDKHIDTIKQEIEAEVFSNNVRRVIHDDNNNNNNNINNNNSLNDSIYMIRPMIENKNIGHINSNSNGNVIHRSSSSNTVVDDRGMIARYDNDNGIVDKKVDMITKNNDIFLNRLTEKLTKHIRNELSNQFMNEGNTTTTTSASTASVIDGSQNHSHSSYNNNNSHGGKQGDSIRELMSQHMDLFLESELSTHTCKICFELMIPPIHTPILLFPCGHTFCKCCMDKHISSSSTSSSSHDNSRQQQGANYNNNHHHHSSSSSSNQMNSSRRSNSTSNNNNNNNYQGNNNNSIDRSNINKKGCPYCRVMIESRAINQSLKELIEQFSKQRGMIQDTSVRSLDQIFPVHHHNNNQHHGNNHSNNHNQSNHSNIYKNSSRKAETNADR